MPLSTKDINCGIHEAQMCARAERIHFYFVPEGQRGTETQSGLKILRARYMYEQAHRKCTHSVSEINA